MKDTSGGANINNVGMLHKCANRCFVVLFHAEVGCAARWSKPTTPFSFLVKAAIAAVPAGIIVFIFWSFLAGLFFRITKLL